jgi:2-oxoglutarate dehydrogenase E1 component
VYYDLLEKSNEEALTHIALIRIEQLYPFPAKLLASILLTYPNLKELIWCQEEPRNQGAWDSTKHRFRLYEDQYRVMCVSRPAAAAPAVGSHKVHHKQQTDLVLEALGLYVNKLNPDIVKEKQQ